MTAALFGHFRPTHYSKNPKTRIGAKHAKKTGGKGDMRCGATWVEACD